MTNGEKFKEVFKISQVDEGELHAYVWLPDHNVAETSIDWWNAEHEEPITKNDLGVDCISRTDVLNHLANIAKVKAKSDAQKSLMGRCMFMVELMPPVTPQKPRRDKLDTIKQILEDSDLDAEGTLEIIRGVVEE